ncbi:hypothetical protein [Pontibacter sp. H249]|uniref:hypothetical protein n=1 Tax=Pontibacter sp. H249 TaxID=3133420 RepID=UPI0030BD6281
MSIVESFGAATSEVLKNDYVVVRYCEADSLLIVDWQRQVEIEERKKVFLWGNQFSTDNHIKNWFINDEEIYIITPEERKWISNTWIKLVAEAGVRKVAVYVPEYFYNTLLTLTDFTQEAQDVYKQLGVTEHEVFTDYNMALTWLRSAQEV